MQCPNCTLERISKFYRVQNGRQIDIHYRAIKAGEAPRELIAYPNVPEDEVDALLRAANAPLKLNTIR